MILTGKAKEDFLKQFCGVVPINETALYAHIIDWFDSVGIYINIKNLDLQNWWSYRISIFPCYHDSKELKKSRQEATTEAIKKANEIYNLKRSNNNKR